MTPLLAAWSSLRVASRSSAEAASLSPAAAVSWNLRIAVLSEDFTALLRRRRFSFCLLRFIWDLMFATRQPSSWVRRLESFRARGLASTRDESEYQSARAPLKLTSIRGGAGNSPGRQP